MSGTPSRTTGTPSGSARSNSSYVWRNAPRPVRWIVSLAPTEIRTMSGRSPATLGAWSASTSATRAPETASTATETPGAPDPSATWIGSAPDGTVARICTAESTVNVVAGFPLKNFTAVAPSRCVPVIVTLVPGEPFGGEKSVIVGGGPQEGNLKVPVRVCQPMSLVVG